MNRIIKFSKNWNGKLDNHHFTTIRLYDERKLKYYLSNVDAMFDVFLEGKRYGQAKLTIVSLYQFGAIPQILLAIDTGKVNYTENIDIFKKFGMYDKNTEMIILLFEKIC